MRDALDVILEELNKQCEIGEWSLEKHNDEHMIRGTFCYKIAPHAEELEFYFSASRPYPMGGFLTHKHIRGLLEGAACGIMEMITGEGLP